MQKAVGRFFKECPFRINPRNVLQLKIVGVHFGVLDALVAFMPRLTSLVASDITDIFADRSQLNEEDLAELGEWRFASSLKYLRSLILKRWNVPGMRFPLSNLEELEIEALFAIKPTDFNQFTGASLAKLRRFCHRSYPKNLNFTREFHPELMPQLRELYLTANPRKLGLDFPPDNLEDIIRSLQCMNLEILTLDLLALIDPAIRYDSIPPLGRFQNLHTLILNFRGVTYTLPAGSLAGLSLRTVIITDGRKSYLPELSKTQSMCLEVMVTRLDDHADEYSELGKFANLRSLNLSGPFFVKSLKDSFRKLSKLTKLSLCPVFISPPPV